MTNKRFIDLRPYREVIFFNDHYDVEADGFSSLYGNYRRLLANYPIKWINRCQHLFAGKHGEAA